MKKEIHPKSYDLEITCSCGAVLSTKSTTPSVHLDVCSACHPFFTGTQKIVDAEGRVERFKKRYQNFVKK